MIPDRRRDATGLGLRRSCGACQIALCRPCGPRPVPATPPTAHRWRVLCIAAYAQGPLSQVLSAGFSPSGVSHACFPHAAYQRPGVHDLIWIVGILPSGDRGRHPRFETSPGNSVARIAGTMREAAPPWLMSRLMRHPLRLLATLQLVRMLTASSLMVAGADLRPRLTLCVRVFVPGLAPLLMESRLSAQQCAFTINGAALPTSRALSLDSMRLQGGVDTDNSCPAPLMVLAFYFARAEGWAGRHRAPRNVRQKAHSPSRKREPDSGVHPTSARSHCTDALISFLHGTPSFLIVLAFLFARAEVMIGVLQHPASGDNHHRNGLGLIPATEPQRPPPLGVQMALMSGLSLCGACPSTPPFR